MIHTFQMGQLGRRIIGAGAAGSYLNSLASTPVFALSLKKLVSTATVAIRVRRSSDNAEQDIGFTGDALDTTALAAFVGSNSAFITTFYDQTGNGFHAVQATTTKQARIVNAGTYDGFAVFDGVDDFYKITAPTMGTQFAGVYAKWQVPGVAAVKILAEQSTNYNNNAQSFVVYHDGLAGLPLALSMRNTTGASDFRGQGYSIATNQMKQHSILFDRSLTGTSEEQAWENGSSLTPSTSGTPAEQTGNFSTYDIYIGARGGASLFTAMNLFTLVVYNADTSAIRTSIEAFVA